MQAQMRKLQVTFKRRARACRPYPNVIKAKTRQNLVSRTLKLQIPDAMP